jgi:hypothetical protein
LWHSYYRYYLRICLEGMRRNMKNVSLGQNLYLKMNEYSYNVRMLTNEPQHLELNFNIEATISYK